ncbi:MAG: hypothetical protein ACI8QZ_000411 [Chlamydiales bacterium]
MQRSPASPRLDALLKRLHGLLTRQIWLHGIGTTLGVTALWLLFAFLADWLMHVPLAVRLLHCSVLFGLPGIFLARSLVRWLRRVPDRAGLAQLIERAHPELNDVLVSAVQLTEDPSKQNEASGPLILRVVSEAETRSAQVDLKRVVAPREPRRRFALGAAAALIVGAAISTQPVLSKIFFTRLFGADVAWPQRTHLVLEIPEVGDRVRVDNSAKGIDVRVARGSDVPVLVRADGVIPAEVTLHFSNGDRSVLTSGGTTLFRTLLRSVQEDMVFSVTGGDDMDRELQVRLTVLQPPDIAGLAVQITPPAYSGLPERTEYAGDVEVLAGSQLVVTVLVDPPDATGIARLLPEGTEIALTQRPYPEQTPPASPASPEEPADAVADAAPRTGLSFSFAARASTRYRFELTDDTGLPNPDPGLYGVQVVEDRRPEVQLISPGRAEVDVVLGGAVPLRVRVHDDFGIAELNWEVTGVVASDEPLASVALVPEVIPAGDSTRRRGGVASFARSRLEVDQLTGDLPLSEGAQVTLQVRARDNREPKANESLSAPVRLRVVTADEFQRRLQDSLARAGEQANRLSRLQVDKQRRTSELLAALSSDEFEAGDRAQIVGLATGQKRVQGDARALSRDLTAIAESLLYSAIDERSGPLLQAIDQSLTGFTDRSFHPEPWRDLARGYASGSLGQAGLAGQLIKIVGTSLMISEDHAAEAERSLALALSSTGPAAMRTALDQAYQHQVRAVEQIERLLEQLAEWDNYQSILTLTRDLVNRQKNLTERTRSFARDH